jgi:hypothetical protein
MEGEPKLVGSDAQLSPTDENTLENWFVEVSGSDQVAPERTHLPDVADGLR